MLNVLLSNAIMLHVRILIVDLFNVITCNVIRMILSIVNAAVVNIEILSITRPSVIVH